MTTQKELKVNFPVSDDLALEIAVRYPYVTLKERGLLKPHQHPISSIERRVVEDKLYGMAVGDGFKSIIDIGGNPHRHAMNSYQVHSCNPLLSPEDNNRNSRFESLSKPLPNGVARVMNMNAGTTWCCHTAQGCNCFMPDCYMSVHSLYYLGPDQVLELLHATSGKRVYAAAHLFEKLVGSYFELNGSSEAHYSMMSNGNIKMNVSGNATTYSHGNMEWLRTCYFEQNGRAMTWSTEMVGETAVMVFRDCPGRFDTLDRLDLSGALCNPNYFGEIEFSKDGTVIKNCGYALNTIQVSKLTSVGRYVFAWRSNNQKVLVPKAAIEQVATYMIGRDRNRDTWQDCLAKTKQVLHEKRAVIPEDVRVKSILYVSYIAFIKYLDEEIAMTNSLLSKNQEKFAWYKRLLSFSPFSVCCEAGEDECPVDRYRSNNGASTCGGLYVNPGKTFQYVKVDMPLKEMKTDSKVTIMRTEPDVKPGQMHQIAMGFRDHIPVVPQVTQEHEIMSVTNRACMKSPAPNSKMWENLTESIKDLQLDKVEPLSFEEWNSNFPKGRRKQHLLAAKSLAEDGLLGRDLVRNSFIKVETYNKGTIDGTIDFDPRLIQGGQHKANVALGPWMAACNRSLKEVFGAKTSFCYASGMTNEQIGDWMTSCLDCFKNPLFFWCDFSRFDATQGPECVKFERKIYESMGIRNYPDAYQVLRAQSNTKGYTRTGLKYMVKATRKSGDSNTSAGNSVVNIATSSQTTLSTGITEFRGIAVGDDMLMVLDYDNVVRCCGSVPKFCKIYEDSMTSYGFLPKTGFSLELCKAEFCSALFWPTKDGHVLGPKPGRLLPKMGFSTSNLNPIQVKGVFLGYKFNCNHIPILNDFVSLQLSLMEGEASKIVNRFKSNSEKVHHMTPEGIRFFEDRYQVDYYALCAKFNQFLYGCKSTQSLLPSGLLDWCYEIDN